MRQPAQQSLGLEGLRCSCVGLAGSGKKSIGIASKLKALGEFVRDSIDGYRAPSEATQSTDLRAAFERRLLARENTLDTSSSGLTAQGDPQALSGSGMGTVHELWTRVTVGLGSGDAAMIERIEEGKSFLRARFEEALDYHDLRGAERAVISHCYPQNCEGAHFARDVEAINPPRRPPRMLDCPSP